MRANRGEGRDLGGTGSRDPCHYITYDVVMRLHRTQLLLEPDQHRALAEIAAQERRSISDVVRGIIREKLAAQDQDLETRRRRGRALIERVRRLREQILDDRGGKPIETDFLQELDDAREERTRRIIGPWDDD